MLFFLLTISSRFYKGYANKYYSTLYEETNYWGFLIMYRQLLSFSVSSLC